MRDMNLMTPDLHDFSDLGISLPAIARSLRRAVSFVARAATRAGRDAGRDLGEFGRAVYSSGPVT